MVRRPIATLVIALLVAGTAAAQSVYQGMPAPLQKVAFDQRLGENVDLSLPFVDSTGRTVELGDLVDGRPTVLALVYYDCPMLCSMTLSGLVTSLRAVDLDVGDDLEVLVVSFDPRETSTLAKAAKQQALERYRRSGTDDGWHFLTGSAESIEQLTDAVGFDYVWDEDREEFAHAAGIVVLTPEGQISRYLLGIEFPSRDLRLALVESSQGTVGDLVDQALLYCYHYDPETGTYSAATMSLVRLGGVVTIALIALFVGLMLRRDRRRRDNLGEPEHVA